MADPDRQYLIYQDYMPPVGVGETCSYGGTEVEETGWWVWSRPPGRVIYRGRVYRYLGVLSGVDGSFEMSCNTGPLLAEDGSAVGPSPAGPVAVAALSLPVLGIGYVAWARQRTRRQRHASSGQMGRTEGLP